MNVGIENPFQLYNYVHYTQSYQDLPGQPVPRYMTEQALNDLRHGLIELAPRDSREGYYPCKLNLARILADEAVAHAQEYNSTKFIPPLCMDHFHNDCHILYRAIIQGDSDVID